MVSKYFKGIKHKRIGIFPEILLKPIYKDRVKFITKFKDVSSGFSGIFQTYGRYNSSEEDFKKLIKFFNKIKQIKELKIIHKSSIIGLPYQLYYKFNEVEVFYDGILCYVEFDKPNESFNFETINKFIDPRELDDSIKPLENALQKVLNKDDWFGLTSHFDYYYIKEIDFNKINNRFKLNLNPDLNYNISYNDKRFTTYVSGVGVTKRGKFYQFYIGNEQDLNSIIGYDLNGLRLLREFLNKTNEIRSEQNKLITRTTNQYKKLDSNFLKIHFKYQSWRDIKRDFNLLLMEESTLDDFKIILNTYEHCVKQKLGFFSKMVSLWVEGQEPDSESKTIWTTSQPTALEFDNSLKIKEISDPLYAGDVVDLKYTIAELVNFIQEIYKKKKDLLNLVNHEIILYTLAITLISLLTFILTNLIRSRCGSCPDIDILLKIFLGH